MTTNVTIEDGLAEQLQRAAEESHISFNQALEKAITAGLPHLAPVSARPGKSKPAKEPTNSAADSLQEHVEKLKKIDEDLEIERYLRARQ
jgi:hypothetical protein